MDARGEGSPSLLNNGATSVPFRCLLLAPLGAGGMSEPSHDAEFRVTPYPISAQSFEKVLASVAPVLNVSVDSEFLCIDIGGLNGTFQSGYPIESLNDFLPCNFVDRFPFFRALADLLNDLSSALQHKNVTFPLRHCLYGDFDFRAVVSALESRADIELLVVDLQNEMNESLNAIVHDAQWQRIEAAWRGIDWLCSQTSGFSNCLVEIADYSKQTLYDDLTGNADVTESGLYQALYSESYGQYGGIPFAAVLVDDYFSASGTDIAMLKSLTEIAKASQFALITAAAPKLLGVSHLNDLASMGSIEDTQRGPRFAKWRSFVESAEASYALMTAPRVRFRPAYGKGSDRVDAGLSAPWFHEHIGQDSEECLWGNSAYLFLANTVRSFVKHGLCTAISEDNGGIVDASSSTDTLPLEYSFSEAKEAELIASGLNPLSYRSLDNELVFRTANSLRWASIASGRQRETLDSIASARLEYLLIVLRIIHCLRILFRESIGTTESPQALGLILSKWLNRFVLDMESPSDEMRNERPLKSARVDVNQPSTTERAAVRISLVPHLQYLGQDVSMEADVGLQLGSA